MKEKSYTLTPEQEQEVKTVIEAGQEKYRAIADVVLERPLTEEEYAKVNGDENEEG